MYRVMCCGEGKSLTVIRIAVSQFILYILLICLSVFGAIRKTDNPKVHGQTFVFIDRLFIIIATLNIIPLLLAIILYVGVATKKYYYVRIYIFIKIFETIINTLLLLSICLFYALEMNIYFGILLCIVPLAIGLWLMECIIVVNIFYKRKTSPSSKSEIVENT